MTTRTGLLALAAATGYISLSQEILWMRAVSYMSGGKPTVFAHVLGVFLIGVAVGALLGERLCERRFPDGSRALSRYTGIMLVVSGVVYYLSIPVTSFFVGVSARLGTISMFAAVMVVASLLGGIFPILCHDAARDGEAAGITVSRIYLANIVGSTLGPLLTGFVLLEYFTTERIVLALSLATLFLGVLVLASASHRGLILRLLVTLGVAGAMLWAYPMLFGNLLERIQFKSHDAPPGPYKYLLENRSGIIAVSAGEPGTPDVIYGGGVYDGRFSTDPVRDVNLIERAYMVAALHPEPAEVLEIGLSSGSWARVLANYSSIRRLTVVEINPGYLDILRHYPEQASVLGDPKVTIVIDDGRRWLKLNPLARFDMIVQNTTFHWRSNVTNLLSEEYLQLCKSHLRPGGVFYYNATGSPDVPYTAAFVFKYVTRYLNFVAASDSPFVLTPQQIRANLLKFLVDGRPLFAAENTGLRKQREELARADIRDQAVELRAERHRWKITDDNMATEFKNARFYEPEKSWAAFWRRRSARAGEPTR